MQLVSGSRSTYTGNRLPIRQVLQNSEQIQSNKKSIYCLLFLIGDYAIGQRRSIDIPIGASNILLEVDHAVFIGKV
jgi:hypothetical protein